MKNQEEKRTVPQDVQSAEGMKEGRLGAERSIRDKEIEETTPNYAFDDENDPDQERGK